MPQLRWPWRWKVTRKSNRSRLWECLPAPQFGGASAWLARSVPGPSSQLYREPPLRCPRKSQWLSLSAASPNILDRSSEINPSFGRPSTRSCSLLESKEAPVRRNWCKQVSQVRMKSRWSHFTELNCRMEPRRTSYFKPNPSCELEKKKKKQWLQPQSVSFCHTELPAWYTQTKQTERGTRKKSQRGRHSRKSHSHRHCTREPGDRRACVLGSSTSVKAVYVFIQTDVQQLYPLFPKSVYVFVNI